MGCVMDVRCEMDPSTTNNKTNTYCLNIDLTQASPKWAVMPARTVSRKSWSWPTWGWLCHCLSFISSGKTTWGKGKGAGGEGREGRGREGGGTEKKWKRDGKEGRKRGERGGKKRTGGGERGGEGGEGRRESKSNRIKGIQMIRSEQVKMNVHFRRIYILNGFSKQAASRSKKCMYLFPIDIT